MLCQGNGHSNGKIILIGEHSVVYGEPAIAFPFNGTQVKANIQQTESNYLTSRYYTGYLQNAPEQLKSIMQLSYRLQTALHTPNFHLTINSTIPAARGMGSSAAVAVAVTRAFFHWSEQNLNQQELLFFVDFAERIAHGNPSGIDAAAASGDEPIFFERKQQVTTFPMNIDAYLLVADTGMLGQTREAVQSVYQLLQDFNKKTFTGIQELGLLTDQAKEAIIENQPEALGEIMTQAQQYLKSLTVSNQLLDDFIQFSLDNGALGAKLTGGGRGGCFLALTKTKEQAEQLAQKLQKLGIKETWVQGLGVYQYA
ncbi:mevalonate kinase [Tetragenococcus muriaticus]|uniref:mevalonate kinase n=2 Tax=Tetragenococcus muriaticus TaxID=64642 RepID=A0A091C9J2_9ENTE|nr:mevalonate kinase [Tetragenococcus muriaticus]KFN92967.1 mevalonate kinase [Tetragenococcus muriaticus 3MR10-3]KFN93535.1 mevalonate kinase [Tetragenococcus muriaticus PMC-11-5]GMA48376.1 mevalonate kinase [Tetragenococcus muriaticus]